MNQTKKILSELDNIFITNNVYTLYHIIPSSKVVTNKTFNTKKTDLFTISHKNKRLWVMYYLLKKETFETNLFKIEQEFRIKNTNRAVGTRISYQLLKKYGHEKLEENFQRVLVFDAVFLPGLDKFCLQPDYLSIF